MADEISGVTVDVLKLNEWLDYQLRLWETWADGRETGWLNLASGNPSFPTLGSLFTHAFTPLQRYASSITDKSPADESEVDKSDWGALLVWARMCLDHHQAACSHLSRDQAAEIYEFKTRSAGTFHVPANLCLAHAATHCAWHLGGITHLLRSNGIAPPARLDLIFFAASSADT